MLELYPHNQKAYDNAKIAFDSGDRTAIIHPTGTGKSLIIAKFILDNKSLKILFISPNVFIHHEIKKHIKKNSQNVTFQTYQYFIKNSTSEFKGYDLIFLDEFHRAGAEEWNKQIQDLLLLNSTAKVLGTTATHIRYLDNERNMAEELFYNNISSFMDLGTAIENGIHKKPTYVSAIYNIREIIDDTEQRLKRNNKRLELENLKSKKVVWEESCGVDYIINKYLTSDRKKILIFCKSIEHIEYIKNLTIPILSKFYKNEVNFNTVHSNSRYSNAKSFFQFQNLDTPQILFTVDMLNEGIHVKGVDTIMMFRDTESPIIYFQQMGRAFTVGQKKEPLIFDFVNNFNIKNTIYSITNNFYNEFKEENSNSFFKKRNLVIDFYDETLDFQKFISEFAHYKTWDENFEEYKTFFLKHGRNPKQSEMLWVNSQKIAYNKGKLTKDQIEILLNVNPKFFDILLKTWDESFEEFKIFFEENGRNPKERELVWIKMQKLAYKKNKLTESQVKRIEEISPDFFKPIAKTWEEYFEEYKKYYELNGKNPRQKDMQWIAIQKVLHKEKKLMDWQVNKILEVNPKFFDVLLKTWDENFLIYKDYFEKNKKNPRKRDMPWIDGQKARYRNGKLKKTYIKKLLQVNPDFFN